MQETGSSSGADSTAGKCQNLEWGAIGEDDWDRKRDLVSVTRESGRNRMQSELLAKQIRVSQGRGRARARERERERERE